MHGNDCWCLAKCDVSFGLRRHPFVKGVMFLLLQSKILCIALFCIDRAVLQQQQIDWCYLQVVLPRPSVKLVLQAHILILLVDESHVVYGLAS